MPDLKILFLSFLLLSGCAASSQHFSDVSELMPPANVEVERKGNLMMVSWNPSPHETRDDFAGYHVYVARRSLVMAPIDRLPEPIVVPKAQHSATVDTLDPKAQYFVHMRSRLQNGALSLPSLPEIIAEANRPKNP